MLSHRTPAHPCILRRRRAETKHPTAHSPCPWVLCAHLLSTAWEVTECKEAIEMTRCRRDMLLGSGLQISICFVKPEPGSELLLYKNHTLPLPSFEQFRCNNRTQAENCKDIVAKMHPLLGMEEHVCRLTGLPISWGGFFLRFSCLTSQGLQGYCKLHKAGMQMSYSCPKCLLRAPASCGS